MLQVLITIILSFAIAYIVLPVVLKIGRQRRIFDLPNERKLHTRSISPLGGVGIFSAFMLSSLILIQDNNNPEFHYFFAAALILFLVGLRDDLVVLSATKKLVAQLVVAALLIHWGGLRLDSMYGLFGINELPENISYVLSYLTIIVVTNSFNLIDGLDGLAGSLGLLSMLLFGGYFYSAGMENYALFAFAMAGSLVAFLIFNIHPARIFMGDSGSLLVGMVNSILVIKFIQTASDPAAVWPIPAAAVVGFAVLFIPLFDTLRVFSSRILKRQSPFTPDRNHIHHMLLDWGFGHTGVAMICVLSNISIIAFTYFFTGLGATLMLGLLLLFAFAAIGWLFYRRPVDAALELEKANANAESKSVTKVIPMVNEMASTESN